MVGEMKKRLQRKGARRGFTLVELLIVIIIIGILAGAMMLVAGTSRDAAEASKIISDLRNVKAAALMWITENPAGLKPSDWTDLNTDPTQLNRYLDKPLLIGQNDYNFATAKVITTKAPENGEATSYQAYVVGRVLGTDVREGVKDNLKKQAPSVGLYKGAATGNTIADIDLTSDESYYTKTDTGAAYVIVQ